MEKTKQTGLRIPEDVLNKIKFVSWHDRRTVTAVCTLSLEEYIERWEATNKPITEADLKAAKII